MIGMTVCSGIGAPEVSAPWIDWRYQSEIDPFPRAVLAHRFPTAIQLGDMTKFQEWPDANLDVLCGGTPCQSFSVAGLRAGLADPRGDLMLTYLAIAARYRPRWLVWENVPGVLSSNGGRDFGTFLGALGQLGYGFAYRVLDAQYVRTRRFPWAVPQRRRRVFVVGHLGDWRRAATVLFDGDSLRGNPPPRREPGKGFAGTSGAGPDGSRIAPVCCTIPARTKAGGGLGTDFDCDGGLIPSVANPLTARMGKGINTTADEGQTPIPVVANALRGEGHDASEDGTGRQTLVPTAQAVAFDTTQVTSPHNYSAPKLGDPCHPLAAGAHPPAVAIHGTQDPDISEGAAHPLGRNHGQENAVVFSCKDYGADAASEVAPTMRAMGHSGSHANAGGQLALATSWAVRRLTPLECERLMGFPDGWTDVPYRGKPHAADGPRYKALGNSWATNCGEWIFDRIKMVEGMA